jgi:hypothetical protein|tara:strand:+ start:100 stop:327 length:228 start_codon:yes stop_codon:yes gene_type:complete
MNPKTVALQSWDDDPIAYIRAYHPILTEHDAEQIRRTVIEYYYNCVPAFKYGINITSVHYVVKKYLKRVKGISDE